MSSWTHIVSCILVDTNIESKEIEKEMYSILDKAPKITGSEGDADIFVNASNDHNLFISMDCNHCCFGQTRKRHKKGGFSCLAPVEYECKEGHYQTRVTITIAGSLRDRYVEQTRVEYRNFIKWLSARGFDIQYKTCRISGNTSKTAQQRAIDGKSTSKEENKKLLHQKNTMTARYTITYTTLQEIKAMISGKSVLTYEIQDILDLINKAGEC